MPRRNQKASDEAPTKGQSPYFINGYDFRNLEEFYDEIERVLIPGKPWGRNMNALADIMTWPCLTEVEWPYTLVWLNSEVSRQRLHHGQMAEWLEEGLDWLKASPRDHSAALLEEFVAAMHNEGPTLFDYLVEVISCRASSVRLILA